MCHHLVVLVRPGKGCWLSSGKGRMSSSSHQQTCSAALPNASLDGDIFREWSSSYWRFKDPR